MKETERILDLWSAARSAGESAVLATVVKTRGSSYRLPGARLLITQGGRHAGSISGGCLEDDLLKKAWWLTENGPVVRRYDTTPDEEIATGGYGLGCNGIIHVRIERLAPEATSALDIIREVRTQRQPVSIEHVVAPGEVWVETLQPPIRLLIFGAGDDAVPLTELARNLGWEVWVFDGRAHYARPERFPQAHEVATRGSSPAPIDPWTVAVIMSHSYSQDLNALRELSSQPLPYLGILGPAKRTAQLLADAELNAAALVPRMRAPMGLDIGADGPEQVALAVIAEIQSVLNGREATSLSAKAGPIHSRTTDDADVGKFEVRSIVCA
jgi:xanthine/CO dehydrogenase XdhC/CoxF family maturation factor